MKLIVTLIIVSIILSIYALNMNSKNSIPEIAYELENHFKQAGIDVTPEKIGTDYSDIEAALEYYYP